MAASALRDRLRRKLLQIGGTDVDFIDDPYLELIADEGRPFPGFKICIARGLPNECHRNSALLWLKGKCATIATGYYLGPDDVWRQHSWGMLHDDTILDSHSAGREYFGVRMESLDAIKFAEDQVGIVAVLRFMKMRPDRFEPIIQKARRSLTAPH